MAAYLTRQDRPDHPRNHAYAALGDVLADQPRARTAIDLGCGDGRTTALALDRCPDLEQVTAIDGSPAMVARARQRFATEPRVDVVTHDFDLSLRGLDLPPIDLAVSAFAIHHVEDDRKRSLFAELHDLLRPDGLFANLEVVTSPSPEEHAEFLAAIGRPADDPEDRLAGAADQLRWLEEAGFTEVACPWRWKGYALLVARR